MGPSGAIIMGFFGMAFAIMAFGPVLGWTSPVHVVAVLVYAAIAARAVLLMRRPGIPALRSARAGRIIMWSSIGEGIGILVMVNLLDNFGQSARLLPGIALVVGLHFLPMAYGIPARRFYAVGGALLAAAAVGFWLPLPVGNEVAGCAAAVALWVASFSALQRGSRAGGSVSRWGFR